jgi:hypothetical protein
MDGSESETRKCCLTPRRNAASCSKRAPIGTDTHTVRSLTAEFVQLPKEVIFGTYFAKGCTGVSCPSRVVLLIFLLSRASSVLFRSPPPALPGTVIMTRYPGFPDFTDVDPYEDYPTMFFEPIDKIWTPTAPAFVPSAHDTILLGVDWDGTGPIIVNFARGHGQAKVMLDPSFKDSGFTPVEAVFTLDIQNALEICQTFIHTVEFSSRWCTVAARKDTSSGLWRHVVRDTAPVYLCEAATFPFHSIDESEIRLTRMLSPGAHQEGMWGELAIDVEWPVAETVDIVRRDLARFAQLNPLPYFYRLLAGLKKDGHITGLLYEPREGRPVQLADRPKILRALRDLVAMDFVYMDVRETHLAIGAQDNEVKLTYPHRLMHKRDLDGYGDPEGLWTALVDRRHRQAADNMFHRLAQREGMGVQELTRYYANSATIFPRPPRPEAFCGIEIQWPDGWSSYEETLIIWREQLRHAEQNEKKRKREQRTARRILHGQDASAQGPAETMTGRVARRSTARMDARRQASSQPTFVFWPAPQPSPPASTDSRSRVSSTTHQSQASRSSSPHSLGGSWTHVSPAHSSSGSSRSSYELVNHEDARPSSSGSSRGGLLAN